MFTLSLSTLAGLLVSGLCGYLIGSISSAIIVSRAMGLPDPRASGSNNPGTTNVLRLGGTSAAVLTLLGDVLKGLLPVLIAKMIGDYLPDTVFGEPSLMLASVGFGAFVGHLYPLFFGFHGGKGVATAGGVFIALSISVAAGLVVVWLLVAVCLRYSSLASLSAAASAPWLVLWLAAESGYFPMSLCLVGLLFWRHRQNIRRLAAGQEGKIRLSGRQ